MLGRLQLLAGACKIDEKDGGGYDYPRIKQVQTQPLEHKQDSVIATWSEIDTQQIVYGIFGNNHVIQRASLIDDTVKQFYFQSAYESSVFDKLMNRRPIITSTHLLTMTLSPDQATSKNLQLSVELDPELVPDGSTFYAFGFDP